jgi:hypothetical protein
MGDSFSPLLATGNWQLATVMTTAMPRIMTIKTPTTRQRGFRIQSTETIADEIAAVPDGNDVQCTPPCSRWNP